MTKPKLRHRIRAEKLTLERVAQLLETAQRHEALPPGAGLLQKGLLPEYELAAWAARAFGDREAEERLALVAVAAVFYSDWPKALRDWLLTVLLARLEAGNWRALDRLVEKSAPKLGSADRAIEAHAFRVAVRIAKSEGLPFSHEDRDGSAFVRIAELMGLFGHPITPTAARLRYARILKRDKTQPI